jgi:hypothetical protein
MTEATKRFFCRTGFLFACFVPTVLIGAWIAWRQSPTYAAQQRGAWQHELARTLGLTVEIGDITEPAPDRYSLQNVVLRDPDAPRDRLPLARLERVDVLRGPAGPLALSSAAEVTAADLPRLWTILHERLVRGPELAAATVHFGVDTISLVSEPGHAPAPTLTDLRVVLQSSSAGANARLQFCAAENRDQAVQMEVVRNRLHYPVATDWTLDARQAAIPTSLLAAGLPAIHELGPDSTFRGLIQVKSRDRNWDARADGDLRQVRLSLPVNSPDLAYDDVLMRGALWQNGQLVSGTDTLVLGRGNYSAARLAQAVVSGDEALVRQALYTIR